MEQVRARLQALVDDGCRRVVAPLGVGHHVDHQVAHAAARRLRGAEVLYYEDAPYVLTPYQLGRRLDRLGLAVPGDPTVQRGSLFAELSAAGRAWLAAPLLRELARPPHHLLALAAILFQTELLHWPRHLQHPQARAEPDLVENCARHKLDAIACYPSQWRLFFPSLTAWGAALEGYTRILGKSGIVERAWRIAP